MLPVPALPDPAQLAAAATEEPPPEPRAALQLESAPPPPDPLRRRPDYRLSPDYGSIPILTHLALPPHFSAQEATSSSLRCVPQAAGGSAAGKPTRRSNRAQHDYTTTSLSGSSTRGARKKRSQSSGLRLRQGAPKRGP